MIRSPDVLGCLSPKSLHSSSSSTENSSVHFLTTFAIGYSLCFGFLTDHVHEINFTHLARSDGRVSISNFTQINTQQIFESSWSTIMKTDRTIDFFLKKENENFFLSACSDWSTKEFVLFFLSLQFGWCFQTKWRQNENKEQCQQVSIDNKFKVILQNQRETQCQRELHGEDLDEFFIEICSTNSPRLVRTYFSMKHFFTGRLISDDFHWSLKTSQTRVEMIFFCLIGFIEFSSLLWLKIIVWSMNFRMELNFGLFL